MAELPANSRWNIMEYISQLNKIKKSITNTPLIDIKYTLEGDCCCCCRHIFAKCEWYSLTGSIKDKVAYQILKDAYETGKLKRGDKIVEVSSGNMGLSLCAIANILGNPTTIIMPKTMSEERKKLIRLYGATLIETEDFTSAFKLCKEMVASGEYYCTEQFANPSNKTAHREITAKEILSHKEKLSSVKTFVAGIGTSGTLSGIGEILKEELNLEITAIEPENARVITGTAPFGKHQLQGLSDEILPELYSDSLVDNVLQISDNDAIAMAQKLARELSLGVGISSGANIVGCILSKTDAITILPDDNKKYLSTNLSTPITTPFVDRVHFVDFDIIN